MNRGKVGSDGIWCGMDGLYGGKRARAATRLCKRVGGLDGGRGGGGRGDSSLPVALRLQRRRKRSGSGWRWWRRQLLVAVVAFLVGGFGLTWCVAKRRIALTFPALVIRSRHVIFIRLSRSPLEQPNPNTIYSYSAIMNSFDTPTPIVLRIFFLPPNQHACPLQL